MCEPFAKTEASVLGSRISECGIDRRGLSLSRTQQELNELRVELNKMKSTLHNILKDRDTLKTLQHYVRNMKTNFYG